jgi:hypothetical protein
MDYTENNYHGLRNITEEIEDRLKKEGKYSSLPVEESKIIKDNIKRWMIEAKRNHTRNQVESRINSAEIIFNA